jgi:peptidoglycan/LPS O-acetylase OafA/YrhL
MSFTSVRAWRPYGAARLSKFDPRDNGITALRLMLALTVVVSHSVVLGGFGVEPLMGHGLLSAGFAAVLGFFALSGFLLGRSRERTSVATFLSNRFLRILPGYWLALVFAGLVAAPIALSITGEAFDLGNALGYVGSNLFLILPAQGGILPAFEVANGSLWTLDVELFGYVMLAAVPSRWLRPVALAEMGLLMALWLIGPAYRTDMTALLIAFVTGILAWQWRDWIPVSWPLMTGAAALALVAAENNALPVVAIGFSYIALGLARNPIRLERDLSYGVYVLAYPVQLTVAQTVIPSFGLWAMVSATLLVLLPLAFLSWTLIERPALGLRRSKYLSGTSVPHDPGGRSPCGPGSRGGMNEAPIAL